MADGASATELRSKDNHTLLDTIDLLRKYGVHQYIPLPQIIVTGDQSAGKSSVLEAISGVRFPIKDSLCTRFATELILRRGSREILKITITPGEGRSPEDVRRLNGFQPSKDALHLSDLPTVIEDAKKALGISQDQAAFCNDVLKVEITGPAQPDLTLVDLPGLIHARSEKTSENDIKLVSNLVQQYMLSSRSIILAVVSAKNDYANQVITTRARRADPLGTRTLGIITKPDALDDGSDSERMYTDLIRKGDTSDFKLGWHALRNRDYTTRDSTDAERDAAEAQFFSAGAWEGLPPDSLGIQTLKPRLSRILEKQIVSELPKLIRDVEAGIAECNSVLTRLGHPRSTKKDQQRYLVGISESFRNIISGAAGGIYTDLFFGEAETEGPRKRLRAAIQDHLLAFATEMRMQGKSINIVDTLPKNTLFQTKQKYVLRKEFVKDVGQKMRNTRGCELPGTFNPSIIGDLFFEQARPWKEISQTYSQKIQATTWTCMDLTLAYVSDDSVRSKIQSHVIDPAMAACTKEMDTKLNEILRPSREGHPITYNHYFTETIQQIRDDRARDQAISQLKTLPETEQVNTKSVETVLNGMGHTVENDMDSYACSEAVECMEAYYQVALKVFIDNFAVLAVEYCMLEKLAAFFMPSTVLDLDDDVLKAVAEETPQSKLERDRATAKLHSLQAGLTASRKLQRQMAGEVREGTPSNGNSLRKPSATTLANNSTVTANGTRAATGLDAGSSSVQASSEALHGSLSTPSVGSNMFTFGTRKPSFNFGTTNNADGGFGGENDKHASSGFGSSPQPSSFGNASHTNNNGKSLNGPEDASDSSTLSNPVSSSFGNKTAAFDSGDRHDRKQSQGTASMPVFQPYIILEGTGKNAAMCSFQSINVHPQYVGFCFEELRIADYAQG